MECFCNAQRFGEKKAFKEFNISVSFQKQCLSSSQTVSDVRIGEAVVDKFLYNFAETHIPDKHSHDTVSAWPGVKVCRISLKPSSQNNYNHE